MYNKLQVYLAELAHCLHVILLLNTSQEQFALPLPSCHETPLDTACTVSAP